MGCIRERVWSNSTKRAWQLSYTDKNGKRHTEQYKYKRDAQHRLSVIESELINNSHTPHSLMRIIDVVTLWLEHKTNVLNRCDATLSQLKTHSNRHILPRIGNRLISLMSTKDVRDFFDDLSGTLSPTMASYVARSFRNLMNFAAGKGYIARNVAMGIKLETPSKIIDESVSDNTLAPTSSILSLILSNASPDVAAEIGCSALAGLRSQEVRALMWKDIDFVNKKIYIRRAANRKNEITTPKTSAGSRSIPLSLTLSSLLNKWKNCQNITNDLIFPSKKGTVKTYEEITRSELYLLLNKLNIKHFCWHQLRDFFATTMVYSDIPKEQLKYWMGHKEYSTTEKYYVNIIKDDSDVYKIINAQKDIIVSK